MVPFDVTRIKIALEKAYEATKVAMDDLDEIAANVVASLEALHDEKQVVGLEHIQDVVEQELMKAGRYEIAKQYIIYRQKHNEERQAEQEKTKEKFEHHQLKVTKDDGSWEFFDIEKVRKTYDQVVTGYEEYCSFKDLEEHLVKYLVDGIKTADIMKMLIKAAIDLISVENIHWQYIAGRLLTSDLYKQSSRQRGLSVQDLYTPESFLQLAEEYVRDDLYYQEFFDKYSKEDFLKA